MKDTELQNLMDNDDNMVFKAFTINEKHDNTEKYALANVFYTPRTMTVNELLICRTFAQCVRTSVS